MLLLACWMNSLMSVFSSADIPNLPAAPLFDSERIVSTYLMSVSGFSSLSASMFLTMRLASSKSCSALVVSVQTSLMGVRLRRSRAPFREHLIETDTLPSSPMEMLEDTTVYSSRCLKELMKGA